MFFENVTTGFCGYCDFDKNFWQKSFGYPKKL